MYCFCHKIRTHHCKVVLLDEQELIQEIQDTSPGQEVLDTVFRHLNLLETSYFGLRYLDSANQTHWLDTTKKVTKQLKGKDTFTLYFGVKFYAADPCKLLEEITRYQFFLQIKQDILQGRLPVSFELAAELGSFVVQSELGDYDPRRHSPGYVSEFRFLSNQTVELENKISELHKDLQGQLPSVAELNYLDKVKWMEMYGVDLHPVLGEDNVEYFLGLTPTGVIVLRNKNKVANYYWPRITKIYFKGRYFMLRVCDKNNDENTYGFETPSKPACKHLYKCCVEHHAFFRLVQVSPNPPDIIGTRFNSGRAEKISQREAQMRLRSPPQFTRTPSRRYQRRIVEGAQDSPKTEENLNNENIPPQEMKTVSIPQPVNSVSSLYRGNVSVGSRCDSPRSTRSAPWSVPHARGLYTGSSPRSLRSAGHTRSLAARRSSSVESHSSNDSRSCKKHRHHRSRRGSDNESDLSRCSGGKSRRHRHRSRRSSGSEHETRHRPAGSKHRYELVDSESQWKEVQRKQAEGSTGIQQATVISSSKEQQSRPRSGYMNSGMETESEHSYHHRRKHRKHRSRSRSPSEGKSRLPEELKQHLEFKLVETEGMSDTQLREIPYKVVETTAAKAVRVRLSPTSKRRTHSARRAKSCMLKEEPPSTGDSPPPPYSETPSAALTDVLNKNSTTQLPRVSNTQTRFNSGNVANRTMCSALYGNPSTLLGNANLPPSGAGHNGNPSPHRRESVDNSSWLNGEYSQNNKISSNSTLGLSSRKSDLPPRPFPFSSMRVSQNNHSTNHGKTWTTPEVRGAVGLPWPTIVDGLYTQSPSNSHLAFNTLPENYASRYNTPDSLKYPSNSSINNHQQYPEQTRPNLNSSHDFLQQVHAATSYLNSYSGTPVHSRSYAKAFIENTNGNMSYDGGTRQNSNRSNWNKDSERSNSVHSSGSSETCLSRTQSSDNFQNRTSEVSNSGPYNKVQGSLFDSPKIVNHLGKPVEETVHSPNHNQSEEKSDGWRETDRGPLYYQKGNEHQQLSSLPISHTQSANSVRTEVNNNPRILHEMSTEL